MKQIRAISEQTLKMMNRRKTHRQQAAIFISFCPNQTATFERNMTISKAKMLHQEQMAEAERRDK